MAFHTPQRIAELTVDAGERKAQLPFGTMAILGFLAGAFISVGFLLDIRVSGDLPAAWGSFGSFLGAAVFPVGLVLVVLAGAELLTGNMMSVPMACFAGRISVGRGIANWIIILVTNFIGSVCVAYFFGHIVGLTETGPYLLKTVAVAKAKLGDPFGPAFVSAIGCNWLVCLAVWLAYGAEDFAGKILGIWFPIMAFVAIGFQHVVANMFVIPAAIFAGYYTWADYFRNFVPVFLGNAVGGAIFVGALYYIAYISNARREGTGE
ncbi:formate/nitrite transporter family protein [Alicyclobacillus cycloheptanicus]|jgi:formate/nitrite transporter|uniref:Formate/nitrite transporter n=1 Tax=Alicyclobacillus cycloheptanicus TaxID=1457 RepID=A0ABT9XGZ8_9BACL|nr:formate/nitrite transporter family protein [Alicyclobacillus cycloheptanicus]MDQ0189467.1 formate/nitrite transporter [Alicyclobacillus cycloheptanicus]WDM02333.1 formate/nitrite transporter family protein [Alicyclobacillus cycloheptanicus]